MDDTVSLCRTCGSRYSSRAWPWLERPDGAPDLRASLEAHVFAAHPEVRWLEGRCASLHAHLSMLRAEAE